MMCINLSIYIYIYIYLSMYLSTRLSVCPSVSLSIYFSIYKSVYMSIYLFTNVLIYPSVFVYQYNGTVEWYDCDSFEKIFDDDWL